MGVAFGVGIGVVGVTALIVFILQFFRCVGKNDAERNPTLPYVMPRDESRNSLITTKSDASSQTEAYESMPTIPSYSSLSDRIAVGVQTAPFYQESTGSGSDMEDPRYPVHLYRSRSETEL